MRRMIRMAALAGATLAAATAPGWGDDKTTPLAPTAASAPKWLSTSESGLYLGPDGFSRFTQNETFTKLGDGLNAGVFSSQYSMPRNAVSALDPLGKYSTGAPPALNGGAPIGPLGGLNTGVYGVTSGVNGQSFSTFGGQVTKDLGGGLAVNFVGAVTRDPTGGYALGPHGSLNMTQGGQVSSTAGAGVTMDLGGGSSFSVSGSVTRGNSRCAGLTAGLCP